jgi:DNA (cytosine-5)-methyltransferase 1
VRGDGLKPFTSVHSALSSIPRNAPNHAIHGRSRGNFVPWDASSIIPNCITTAGANGRGHPNGKRGLTEREVASLQTFPHDHVFKGKAIRKQIGNAVPPLIGKLMFSCVRRHLERCDEEEKEGLA